MQVRQTAKENKIRKCDHLFKMSGLGRKLFMIISILEHWVSTSFLSRLLLLFLPRHKKSALSALLNGLRERDCSLSFTPQGGRSDYRPARRHQR